MSSAADTLATHAEKIFRVGFGGVLRVECTGDGSSLWVDGRQEPPVISQAAPPEVMSNFCLWRGDLQTLHSVLSGQRLLETAYTAGQLKISGDMAVMARLSLGDAA